MIEFSDMSPRDGLVEWVRRDALPLWHNLGWDMRRGGFVERLDISGSADYDAPRRVRVQARQVYVYAHAAILGWYEPAASVAQHGFDWMIEKYYRPGGKSGFLHIVSPDGAIVDGRIDAYDQAFGLLALAWMYRLTKDSQILALIHQVIAFVDEEIADPENGGWFEGVPHQLPRRQNPQMHAFEAMLALYEATGAEIFLERATKFLALLTDKLLDPSSGLLLEYFDGELRPPVELSLMRVEPGHHFEWTWLILTYARLRRCPPPVLARKLYQTMAAQGIFSAKQIVDEISPDGSILQSSRRLWPITEYIRANLVLEEHTLDSGANARTTAAIAELTHSYLKATPRGAWIDKLDVHGVILDGQSPASSFYHIFGAAAEVARLR
jgi:mannose-6-phosphate isomerase